MGSGKATHMTTGSTTALKILVYGNRKEDDRYYDISTPEKEAAAFMRLFYYLDEEWHVYQEFPDPRMKALYAKAQRGDAKAAKELMFSRQAYEYEEFQVVNVKDPTKERWSV